MEKQEIIFEVLQATGLNWTVEKQPIYLQNGNAINDAYATVRKDNNACLGVVGNKYSVLQNHEAIESIYEAGKEVFNKDTGLEHPWNNASTLGNFGNIGGGSLKEGKAVFIQLELPEMYIGKSDVKRFITVTNKHDGTGSLGFGTTNQVVCCSNTFAIANKALGKIRHTASMQQRIDDAVKALRVALDFENRQVEVFNKAANIQFNNNHVRSVMETLFGKANLDNPNASTRLKNQVKEFALDVDTSVVEQGETIWSLFNAVTRYTNHSRSTKDKDFSLLFGTDAKINQKVYNLMEEWV